MRFILNFFFFGILFYLIWMFFPDAFMKLVSWADQIVVFFRDLFVGLWEKSQHYMPEVPRKPENPTTSFFLIPLLALFKQNLRS